MEAKKRKKIALQGLNEANKKRMERKMEDNIYRKGKAKKCENYKGKE